MTNFVEDCWSQSASHAGRVREMFARTADFASITTLDQ